MTVKFEMEYFLLDTLSDKHSFYVACKRELSLEYVNKGYVILDYSSNEKWLNFLYHHTVKKFDTTDRGVDDKPMKWMKFKF